VRGSVGKPDAFMVIAEEAGEVVGMAVGMQGLDADGAGPPIPGYCHITAVFVAPDRWGNGIGGRTVDAVLAEARARNYDYVRLWTHADNERAQRLYEHRGFRRTSREHIDDDGERIVQYGRELTDP
jgi:ribosomal protein S18 acetylase RimI-like enzyme